MDGSYLYVYIVYFLSKQNMQRRVVCRTGIVVYICNPSYLGGMGRRSKAQEDPI
jgi:hypothetical protein